MSMEENKLQLRVDAELGRNLVAVDFPLCS